MRENLCHIQEERVPQHFTRRTIFIIVCLATITIPAVYWLAVNADTDAFATAQQDRTITPAGKLVLDASNGLAAIAPLTMNFVRTPDNFGPDKKGRYLLAVNSGWGMQVNSRGRQNQSLSVIDLNKKPDPQVVQTVYFPSPQSANVGIAFDQTKQPDGKFRFFVSGGFENKIWILSYDPAGAVPIAPINEPDKPLEAPFVDVSAFAENAPSPNYNSGTAAVYPTGIALSPDARTLYTANNLGDTLGIISDLRDQRRIERIKLSRPASDQFVYPYDVRLLTKGGKVSKIYVSLWGDGSIAVVDPNLRNRVTHLKVERHPTLMISDRAQTRLYVVNSDADSVSVINTATDRVIETIDVRLNETAKGGVSPEGLALSEDEQTLYVANAHANAVAVVQLAKTPTLKTGSKLLGFIPTGNYASAVAVVGNRLFIANGKGTGMDNSSNIANETGMYPNMPNSNFPGDRYNKQGMHPNAIVNGNISVVNLPDEKQLFAYTQQAMRNNGLLGRDTVNIFPGGKSPFKHVIYVIRENRTYDQVLGDISASGDGSKADGEPAVAIFGSGMAARIRPDVPQDITPNAHALALRFGLLDRFFVNAEASPDGHNWSTAAFSNDYIDKAFRWSYSRRGRTYDYEGFNRLPSYEPPSSQPPVALPSVFNLPATEIDVANYLKRYVPYYRGARDVGEPETLYLWDAAKRAGLTYRNYGEFVATVSADDVRAINQRRAKQYPDTSPTVTAFAAKKTLEDHISPTARNFDMETPDAMTTGSYRAAVESKGSLDAAITTEHADQRFRGTSRFGEWLKEFRGFIADLQAGRPDRLPNLSIVRFSNDHTAGISRNMPTPQFFVADNDYALGRMVEEISKSPYWKDTAIFVVEDDAQDGPDHVDAHRSPAFVISAYNRPGALIHEFHTTVSLIRTLELCIGIEPMNFLDSNAVPIDIFTDTIDLRPFTAILPTVTLDNLMTPERPTRAMLEYIELTAKQDLSHNDMADPRELNEIIWFSVRGNETMPGIARLPAFELMRIGLKPDDDSREADDD
jgi:YVTN family beta-propeller protein